LDSVVGIRCSGAGEMKDIGQTAHCIHAQLYLATYSLIPFTHATTTVVILVNDLLCGTVAM